MVQTANARQSHDSRCGWWSHFTRALLRRISETSVSSLRVMVADIVAEEAAQVILIEHDHVIPVSGPFAPTSL